MSVFVSFTLSIDSVFRVGCVRPDTHIRSYIKGITVFILLYCIDEPYKRVTYKIPLFSILNCRQFKSGSHFLECIACKGYFHGKHFKNSTLT
jgi:hypothetical protein